jgi:pectinesterase
MNRLVIKFLLIVLMPWLSMRISANAEYSDIIVDKSGQADYSTITDALNALPMFTYQRVVIFITNGIYEEKLRIDQHYVTLKGQNRDSTIIRYNQLRSDWNEDKDPIGPAVVNIFADDIVLENLTVENTQPEIGPHAFAVYGKNTRTIIKDCSLISKGADTVSLWDYKDGMYYHVNCYFQGAVDFVCPRGCCFIKDSEFYEVKKSASLWHDGHFNPDQKMVIRNSCFDGVEGFMLGRHHYDAQFFLIDCRFSKNMANQPIFRKIYEDQTRNNPYLYRDRKYFFNCSMEGEDYIWFGDNFDEVPGRPKPEEITASWTFNDEWDPENNNPVTVTGFTRQDISLLLTFDEIVTVRGEPLILNRFGKQFRLHKQRFNDINKLMFEAEEEFVENDLSGEFRLINGDIIASRSYVNERSLGSIFNIISQVKEK